MALCCCLPVQYSVPKPKGGRHANNPFTVPDQKVTYCQPKKRESRLDVFSPDYTSLSSPFVAHDVTSRGANMAFAKGGLAKPRNPNEVRRKGKRRRWRLLFCHTVWRSMCMYVCRWTSTQMECMAYINTCILFSKGLIVSYQRTVHGLLSLIYILFK